jgi:hypothetical protein
VADGPSSSDVDWIDKEAARWVWRRIPPHLAKSADLATQLIDALAALRETPLSLIEEKIDELLHLAYQAHNEVSTAGTMYKCVGEWMKWDERHKTIGPGSERG